MSYVVKCPDGEICPHLGCTTQCRREADATVATTLEELTLPPDPAPPSAPREEVAPYKVRIQLNDRAGSYLDLLLNIDWPTWLARFLNWRGVPHDKGFIPVHGIAYIVHLNEDGKPPETFYEGNVVPLKPRTPTT